MPVQIIDERLLKKLVLKTGKDSKYLREQISKRASRKNVSSQAYFVFWLKKNGIGAENYRKKLSQDIRSEIISLTSNTTSIPNKSQKTIKHNKSVKTIKVDSSNYSSKAPLLSANIITNSIQNANLYPLIYMIENVMRDFVTVIMRKNFGNDWWENEVKKEIKQDVSNRMRKETLNPWVGKRSDNPIYYTDFSNLVTIIRSKPNEFTALFKDLAGGINWLTQRMEELYFMRNNIAHSCPLRKQDQALIKTYFATFYDIVDSLNSKI